MVRFEDGFDASNTKWDLNNGTLVTGAFGQGRGLQGPSSQYVTLGANYADGFVAFHYFTDVLGAQTIWACRDAGGVQLDLRVDGSGGLFFTRNGTTLGSVSTPKLAAFTLYSFVIKFSIHPSAGVAEVKANGTTYLSLSSQNTRDTANSFFNQLLISSGGGLNPVFDNFVFWDTVSGSGNDLTGYPTGQLVVDTAFVTGAGDNADFAPLSSTNASNVDDNPDHDADSTYNSSLTANDVDTFVFGSLHATSGTVIAIGVNTIDRIDDATPHTVSHRLKSSSSITDGTAFSSTGTYKNHQTLFTLDPATSAAPTVSGRNAMKFGYKLVS